jgi:hypothetical protein
MIVGSYDRPKYLDPRKKYFGNTLAHLGSIFFLFFLNVSSGQSDAKYVPNYGFKYKGSLIASSKVRNSQILKS